MNFWDILLLCLHAFEFPSLASTPTTSDVSAFYFLENL